MKSLKIIPYFFPWETWLLYVHSRVCREIDGPGWAGIEALLSWIKRPALVMVYSKDHKRETRYYGDRCRASTGQLQFG